MVQVHLTFEWIHFLVGYRYTLMFYLCYTFVVWYMYIWYHCQPSLIQHPSLCDYAYLWMHTYQPPWSEVHVLSYMANDSGMLVQWDSWRCLHIASIYNSSLVPQDCDISHGAATILLRMVACTLTANPDRLLAWLPVVGIYRGRPPGRPLCWPSGPSPAMGYVPLVLVW